MYMSLVGVMGMYMSLVGVMGMYMSLVIQSHEVVTE